MTTMMYFVHVCCIFWRLSLFLNMEIQIVIEEPGWKFWLFWLLQPHLLCTVHALKYITTNFWVTVVFCASCTTAARYSVVKAIVSMTFHIAYLNRNELRHRSCTGWVAYSLGLQIIPCLHVCFPLFLQ